MTAKPNDVKLIRLADTVLFEAVEQGVSGDSQQFGCPHLVLVGLFVSGADNLLDHIIEADSRGRNPGGRELMNLFFTLTRGWGGLGR